MTRRRVTSGGRGRPRPATRRAIAVGDACFVSGTTDAGPTGESLHPGDAAAQARAALAIIEGALNEAGFALDDVVRTRMFIVDPADADAVAAVHGEVFAHVRPAATLVVVARLMTQACSSRSRPTPARARAGSGQRGAERSRDGDDPDAHDQPEQQVPPPDHDRETGEHAHGLDAHVDLARAVGERADERVGGGERRQDGRPDQPQVEQRRRGRRSIPGASSGMARVGYVTAAISTARPTSSTFMRRPPRAGRPLQPRDLVHRRSTSTAWPVISDSPGTCRPSSGTAIAINGPSSPPAMIPISGPIASDSTTPRIAPAPAATSSRRPVTSPAARPAIAAGNTTSRPSRAGSGIAPPSNSPAIVARFHGMNTATTAAIQYPGTSARPIRRKCARRARTPRRSGRGPSRPGRRRHLAHLRRQDAL